MYNLNGFIGPVASFLYSICLCCQQPTATNEASRRQVRAISTCLRHAFDQKRRKLIADLHELVESLVGNQVCDLDIIMEFSPYRSCDVIEYESNRYEMYNFVSTLCGKFCSRPIAPFQTFSIFSSKIAFSHRTSVSPENWELS